MAAKKLKPNRKPVVEFTEEELRAILARCEAGYVPDRIWEPIKSIARKLRAHFGVTP